MMAGTLRSAARLTAWTAGLLITGRLLYGLGSGDVRMPLTSLTDLQRWLADTPPATMAMAVLRLAALAGVAYLVAATALAVAAGLIRARPLEAAARRLTPAVVRRIATGGGGVGLALGAALGSVPAPDLTPHPIIATGAVGSRGSDSRDADSPNVATMTRHDPHLATMTRHADPPAPGPAAATPSSGPEETGATPGPDARSPGPTSPASGAGPPHDPNSTTTDHASGPAVAGGGSLPTVLGRIGRAADTPGPSPPAVPDDGGPTGAAELPPLTATMIRIDGSPAPGAGSGASPLPQPGNTWLVGPGDSFWSIAADVLTSPGGNPPGERDVGRYWRRLIDANRARLVDRGNPDLLLPGQELVLPP
jgi:hypothetical protein